MIMNDIINSVAVEIGLQPYNDAVGSAQDHFKQLVVLANVAGNELTRSFIWSTQVKDLRYVMDKSREYDLPDDYMAYVDDTAYIIDGDKMQPQSMPVWAERLATTTPLNLGEHFVIRNGKIRLLEDYGTDTFNITYQSKNWLRRNSDGVWTDTIETGQDTINLDDMLFSRLLKLKYLEAKGFDTQVAQNDYNQMFSSISGKDRPSGVLSVASEPLLSYANVPDGRIGL